MYRGRSMFVAAALAVGLWAAHLAPALAATYEDPGITDTEIRIGVFSALTGPAVSYGIDPMRVVKAFYKEVNGNGGIYGRKIVLVEEDDKCSGTQTVAAVKKLVSVDKVFLMHGGVCSSSMLAAMDYVQREKVPLVGMTASMDGMLYPPQRYIFGGFGGTVHSFGGAVVDFAKNHLKASRIAYVRHDDEYGAWGYESFAWQMKQEGLKPVAVEQVNRDIADVTPVVLRLKSANPDVVILMTYDRPGALITRDARRLGLNVPVVLGATGAINITAFAQSVGSKDAFRNFYYQSSVRDNHKTGPLLAWARQWYATHLPEAAKEPDLPSAIGLMGLASSRVVKLGLELAGPHPTREKFIQALEGLRDMDTGVMAGTLSFGPDDHAATEQTTFYKFDGEKAENLGSFVSRWKAGQQ